MLRPWHRVQYLTNSVNNNVAAPPFFHMHRRKKGYSACLEGANFPHSSVVHPGLLSKVVPPTGILAGIENGYPVESFIYSSGGGFAVGGVISQGLIFLRLSKGRIASRFLFSEEKGTSRN